MTDDRSAGDTVRAPGWLRRNRWGVVALLPAAVFAVALQGHDAYTTYRDAAPRVPITGHAPAWVAFEGTTVRLDSLTRLTAVQDDLGSPVTIPPGMSVWRATIQFRATNWSSVAGCMLTMEDTAGATYAADPQDLNDLGIEFNIESCSPDGTIAVVVGSAVTAVADAHKVPYRDTASITWERAIYFLAPSTARPVAVRVTTFTSRPRYARLTPP